MNTETNPLALDDEAFSKLNGPPEAPAVSETTETVVETKPPVETETEVEETEEEEEEQEEQEESEEAEKKDDKPSEKDDKLPTKDKLGDESKTEEEGKGKPKGEPKADPVGSDAPPNFEEFYKKVMAPLNANGKKIELKTPEEAIQLMQMGANYTRKMQAIAPHRKVLTMLENNGLLNDEGKLALLIDINKKDPEAIKKFLKDSGIDPLDIDTKEDSTYQEGNHRVTDAEVTFRTTLDELSSIPEGRETLKQINTQWDQASKEVLWDQPEVMTLIHQHRENGIYDLITTEIERQRALGGIPASVSYLQAYKKIGDDLTAAGAFNHLAEKAPQEKPAASHVVTRKVVPKKDPNGDKANAASTSRNAGRKAETVVNPLSLSDEEFEKQFDVMRGRV